MGRLSFIASASDRDGSGKIRDYESYTFEHATLLTLREIFNPPLYDRPRQNSKTLLTWLLMVNHRVGARNVVPFRVAKFNPQKVQNPFRKTLNHISPSS